MVSAAGKVIGLRASEGISVGRGREASKTCLALSLSSGSSVVLKSESEAVSVGTQKSAVSSRATYVVVIKLCAQRK